MTLRLRHITLQTFEIRDSAVEFSPSHFPLTVLVSSFSYPPKGLDKCMHGEGALACLGVRLVLDTEKPMHPSLQRFVAYPINPKN